jgi:hypothetical protein
MRWAHECLYVVRELRRQRVWFAEPLLSSAAAEVHRLFERARDWASSNHYRLSGAVELLGESSNHYRLR